MLSRKATAFAILLAFLALAVLSFLGDRVLSAVFVVVAGAVLGHHALRLCPRCSNRDCAFNPRFGHTDEESGPASSVDYSDLPINRTTVIPLLLTGPLAVIGAWRFSPYWTVAVAAFALTAHHVFTRQTCSRCGNDCVGNRNPDYRAWKCQHRAHS